MAAGPGAWGGGGAHSQATPLKPVGVVSPLPNDHGSVADVL